MSRKNYTEKEKRELLSIVDKYKAIIENKSTNAVTVERKNETWEIISTEFNSNSEYPRTAKQLTTAYQNLKRLTRQKVADDNMQNYISKNMKEDLKKFKKDAIEDKKAIKATGGGRFTPSLSEVGAQMLALMGDQVIPLSNDCDSATDYYKVDDKYDDSKTNEVIDNTASQDTYEVEIEVYEEPPQPQLHTVEENTPNISPPKNRHTKTRQIFQKKKTLVSTGDIKRKFYQKKLECALVEKKTNIVNYKLALKKDKLIDLDLKIRQIEYSSKLKET